MATFKLRQFSHPEFLKQVAPERLLQFLEPHAAFLKSRGFSFPATADAKNLDYQSLANIFAALDTDVVPPKDLVDGLFFLDEMSTQEGMDSLLTEVERQGLTLDEDVDQSPGDIAVQVWFLDRDILERKHAEQYLIKPRTYEYYQSTVDLSRKKYSFSPKIIQNLEDVLNDEFEKKKRGRNARVFMVPNGDEISFLIGHGNTYKREGSIEGGKPSSVFFRPEIFDVVVFSKIVSKLRIKAGSKWEKELYRTRFGKHLFGNKDFFPGKQIYTLEPLRDSGADCLSCFNVDGIEWVKLIEIHYYWGGVQKEIEIRKAEDIYAALEARGKTIPEKVRIIQAKFRFKFLNSKTPRTVKIRPGNVVEYTRDDGNNLVEEWMKNRGFILPKVTKESNIDEEVLVGD